MISVIFISENICIKDPGSQRNFFLSDVGTRPRVFVSLALGTVFYSLGSLYRSCGFHIQRFQHGYFSFFLCERTGLMKRFSIFFLRTTEPRFHSTITIQIHTNSYQVGEAKCQLCPTVAVEEARLQEMPWAIKSYKTHALISARSSRWREISMLDPPPPP